MGLYPMAIDHVLAGSGQLDTRPLLGSDHFGLLARVVPAAGPAPEDQAVPISAASNGERVRFS